MEVKSIKRINENMKNISEHLKICNSTEEGLRKKYKVQHMSLTMKDNIKAGLKGLTLYNNTSRDNTLFSDEEFCALVGFFAVREYDEENIKQFIWTLKYLEIEDDDELPFIISRYFDDLYFSFNSSLDYVRNFINDTRIWNANRISRLEQLSEYLYKQQEQAEEYKRIQKRKIEKYFENYESFKSLGGYKCLLLRILRKKYYDANTILGNMPDIGIVLKDCELLKDEDIVPKSFVLMEELVLRDMKLRKFSNNLGTYKLQSGEVVKVPFTRTEFLSSIHRELSDEDYKPFILR